MFALLAIRLFGDKLYSCNDGAITTGRQDCFGNFYNGSGILMPLVWGKPDYNFDSLGKVRRGSNAGSENLHHGWLAQGSGVHEGILSRS